MLDMQDRKIYCFLVTIVPVLKQLTYYSLYQSICIILNIFFHSVLLKEI